ncbi:MAG TPA: NAD(+)/NADH kinase [Terriglobales bacterium]|nr:NAD(+)/NADH kinase [Terriglobales bacterium]
MVSKKTSSAARKSVAIVSKPDKPQLARIVPELVAWLGKHQYRVVVDPETASHAPGIEVVPREQIAARPISFVIVLGGDGTLLAAARCVARAGIPVLGVNLGSLGFLTEVPLEELYPTLEGIDAGHYDVETRSMVHCEVMREGSRLAAFDALNDVVMGKATISRLNHCDVYIDGEFVSAYKTDSLIVSTPTGSTAYSLAAGGPIVMPTVDALIVTPVAAHSLTHRPLVVPKTSKLEIVISTGAEQAYLSVDGQVGMPIHDGDRVYCSNSQQQVKLLRIRGTFFDVLRAKLKWGQR